MRRWPRAHMRRRRCACWSAPAAWQTPWRTTTIEISRHVGRRWRRKPCYWLATENESVVMGGLTGTGGSTTFASGGAQRSTCLHVRTIACEHMLAVCRCRCGSSIAGARETLKRAGWQRHLLHPTCSAWPPRSAEHKGPRMQTRLMRSAAPVRIYSCCPTICYRSTGP